MVKAFRDIFIIFVLCGGMTLPSLPSAAEDAPQLVLPIGHTSYVFSVAFSPDGKYALSGSEDKTLKLWEVATGGEVRAFAGHTDYVRSVAFSPDGRYALSGSVDNTLKFWEVDTGELLFTRLHVDESDWIVVASDGRFDGSPDGIKLMYYAKDNNSIPIDTSSDPFYTPDLVAQLLKSAAEKGKR